MINKTTKNNIKVTKIISDDYFSQIITIKIANEVNVKNKKILSINSLAAQMLKHKTTFFKTKIALEKELETLYNSKIAISPFRSGNKLGIKLTIYCVNKEYTLNNEDLTDQLLDYTFDLLTSAKKLKIKDLKKEKQDLVDIINEGLEDKKTAASYALQQLVNIDYRKENSLGNINDISKITVDDINKYYSKLFKKAIVKVEFSSKEDIQKKIIDNFPIQAIKSNKFFYEPIKLKKSKEKIKKIDGTQSYLNIAIPIKNTKVNKNKAVHLNMLNVILGGSATSKLFTNVREKHSLAYYAASKMQFHDSYIEIYTGIEAANFNLAKKVIFEEIEKIKTGQIETSEIENVKKIYDREIKACKDYHASYLQKQNLIESYGFKTIEEYVQCYQATTIEDLISIAKQIDDKYVLNFWEGEKIEK